jgi:hypothetical protein
MAKKARKYGPRDLPKELVIFWNESSSEPFLQISQRDEDAFVEAGSEDTVVGVYHLEKRVRLMFEVRREDV